MRRDVGKGMGGLGKGKEDVGCEEVREGVGECIR